MKKVQTLKPLTALSSPKSRSLHSNNIIKDKIEEKSLRSSITTPQAAMGLPRSKLNKNDYFLIDTQSLVGKNTQSDVLRQQQQEHKDEHLNIISLNHWKHLSQKTNTKAKSQSYTQQSLNKLLNQGRVLSDDKSENPQFPSPNINQKLILSICNEQDQYQYKNELCDDAEEDQSAQNNMRKQSQLLLISKMNSNEVKPRETQDIQRKHANQKLINQILYNKISKNPQKNQVEAKASTSEVLSGFKSLTAMFKTINQMINYEDIYNQIVQEQKMPARMTIITKEFDRNLERQQQNFNDIVQNKNRIIKDQINEVEIKKTQLNDLRVQNCYYREVIQDLFLQLDELKKKNLKSFKNLLNDNSYKESKKDTLKHLREVEFNESNKLMSKLQKVRQELKINQDEIDMQEGIFLDLQEQKNNSKQEFSEFLKMILKNEDIQIQDSLTSIVKVVFHIKMNLTLSDFPNYLDIHARNFILQKGQLSVELDELKKKLRQLNLLSQQDFQKDSQRRSNSSLGNRPFYEQKMREVQQAFSSMKKENFLIKKIQAPADERNEQKKKKYINIDEQDEVFKESKYSLKINEDFKPKEVELKEMTDTKQRIMELEGQCDQIEKVEIQRHKAFYQQKTLGVTQIQRLVKTVQAEFGAKLMNGLLNEIFNEHKSQNQTENLQSVIQVGQGQTQQAQEAQPPQKQVFSKFKSKQRLIMDAISENQDINYKYDPIYNQIPYLQNMYKSSTYFPSNTKQCHFE